MSAPASDTYNRILDIAERLVQTRGYNGFSYADISHELRIQKASLHHHFPSKAALGKALIARYETNFLRALADISRRTSSVPQQLAAYVKIYANVLRKDRMCLCGMLAADFATLPPGMRKQVKHFFQENEAWLVERLEHGRSVGAITYREPTRTVANYIVSALEGAMLVARSLGKASHFDAIAKRLLGELAVRPP